MSFHYDPSSVLSSWCAAEGRVFTQEKGKEGETGARGVLISCMAVVA